MSISDHGGFTSGWRPRLTVRQRVFLVLAVTGMTALVAVNLAWLPGAIQDIHDARAQLQFVAARGVRDQLDVFLGDREAALLTAAQVFRAALLQGVADNIEEAAYAFLQRERGFEQLALVDEGGTITHQWSRRTGIEAVTGQRWQGAIPPPGPRAVRWGSVFTTKTSEPWVTLATIVPSPIGGRQYHLISALNIRSLWALTGELKLSAGGRALVVDSAGRLIAADDPSLVLKRTSFADRSFVRSLVESGATAPVAGSYVNERGVEVTATGLRLERAGWGILVEHPRAVAAAAIGRKLWFFGALTGVGIGLMATAAHVVSRRLTRPIQWLQEGAARLGGGDLGFRVTVNTDDELGALARQFNDMADQLHAAHTRLEERVAEATRGLARQRQTAEELARVAGSLTENLDVAGVGHRVVDSIPALFDVSSAVLRLAQADGSLAVVAASGLILQHFPPGHLSPPGVSFAARAVREGRAVWSSNVLDEPGLELTDEHRRRLLESGERAILAVPLRVKGTIIGALAVVDTKSRPFSTDEIRLLQLLADQAAVAIENARLFEDARRTLQELNAANTDLNGFVYSVSHDLKAPLVAIQGLAALLADDHGPELGDRGRRYIDRICANTAQMERLIHDLLALSRIGREARPREEVLLLEVVQEVLHALAEPIAARSVKVVCEDLGSVWGIRTQVEQVFTNLISNAVKYLGDAADPRVEIGSVERDHWVECWVTDNGIGIDHAYHDTVFELFQRLQDVKTEGTGVGLAIVKKIVEGAGGRIWVESARGQGATFRFTWPKTGPGRARSAA